MIGFNLVPLFPEIFLSLIAMGLLIVGVGRGNSSMPIISWAAIIGFFIAIILIIGLGSEKTIVLNGMFIFDSFAGVMKIIVLIGLIITTALSIHYLRAEGIARFEYPVLVILAGVGMMIMVSANNLLTFYMGLELQSLCLYILASFYRSSFKSAEAGIKYFILGALSSGMILFGISLIYGYTASLDYVAISSSLSIAQTVSIGAVIGMVFVLAGLAFKLSLAPFHMWTPDVYQGAPSCVTALFAIVPKIAAFGLLIRFVLGPFAPFYDEWMQVLYLVSVLSMTVGAFAAIAQTNIKRLLAYSSIGHMGYALIGLIVGTGAGLSALITYLVIYVFMSAGVFTIVLSLRRGSKGYDNIEDLSGLSHTHPVRAYMMALFMFSMAGIPPLAGFFGKLFVFNTAMDSGFYILAIYGVLTSVVAAFYYLKIIKVMFFEEAGDRYDGSFGFVSRIVLFVGALFVVGFIFKTSIVTVPAQKAAAVFYAGLS